MGVTRHSIIAFLCDRSRWWKKKKEEEPLLCWDSGVKKLGPWGSVESSLRYYIMFIQEGVHTPLSHMCQCPAGWLWSWLPTALLLPPGSDTSEGHNFSQIKATKAPLAEARDAMGYPLTFDLSHESWKEKIKPLLPVLQRDNQRHGFEAGGDMKVSSQREACFCFYPSL